MNKQFLIFFGLGILAVAGYLGFYVTATKDSHLRLDGKILKVRTAAIPGSAGDALVVVDVRLTNPTNVPFVANSVRIRIEPEAGRPATSFTIPKPELDTLFRYIPHLGPRLSDIFGTQDRVGPHEGFDRTLGARIETSAEGIAARKALVLLLEDVDGAVLEIREEPKK